MKFIIAIMMIVLLAACTVQTPSTILTTPPTDTYVRGTYVETSFDLNGDANVKTFSSVNEYEDFVNQHEQQAPVFRGGGVMMETAVLADASQVKTAPNDYSETNVQVAGVDEADIMKSDGEYIYTISGTTLYVIKAYPGEDAKIESSVSIDGQPKGLFVKGNDLVVFGSVDYNNVVDIIGFRPQGGLSFFTVYDISDKTNVSVKNEYHFEGSPYDGRLIDDTVYFVTRSYPEVRDTYPLPLIIQDGNVKEMPVDRMFFIPQPYDNIEQVNVHSIDLSKRTIVDSISVSVDRLHTLYMSENNLYVVSSRYINEYELRQEIVKELLEKKLSAYDKKVIQKIKDTDNDVLTQGEKKLKIMAIYYKYENNLKNEEKKVFEKDLDSMMKQKLESIDYFEYTIVNKIHADDGKLSFVANGKVPGRIVNQFSLDEHDGYLRMATTVPQEWSQYVERKDSTNGVYVLDSDLDIVGSLTGLAQTEQIYSTRFVGDRLYLVTFKQTDPFFVIDLSNPRQPTELGQLKIPGFSRYLHPYDDTHLIGLGRDATATGRQQGLKISIYDVTDVGNPIETANYVTDERYVSSTAEYEHKAFLFDKDKKLLVIPAFSYEWNNGKNEGYNGAMVFYITENEIKLQGLIDHGGENYYSAAVERSMYINELLYTKSPNKLRINKIEDLGSVKTIELDSYNGPIPLY